MSTLREVEVKNHLEQELPEWTDVELKIINEENIYNRPLPEKRKNKSPSKEVKTGT